MIWFWAVAALLTLGALGALLRPLIRAPQTTAEEEPVAALYRRQLTAIDDELAQDRLRPEQAAAARNETTRRMLAAAERERAAAARSPGGAAEVSWRIGAAIGIAGLLPVAVIAVYFAVGTPTAISGGPSVEAAVPHGAAELAAAAERIKAHLQEVPDDLKGWTLLARTYASLSRFPEACAAYARAIALAPQEIGLHAELGEVLVLAAEGTVTPAAMAEFAKAPDDPRSRYYAAEAAWQRGDKAAAKEKLQALLAAAPADAPWRQAVADRLAEIAPSGSPTSTEDAASPSGPSAQDIAAARSMPPEERLAMIRGMVARLAERLEHDPGDRAGWERLAHAYDVLGEPDKARAARARETAAGTGTTTAVPPGVLPGAAPQAVSR